jgi:hypothetical protein
MNQDNSQKCTCVPSGRCHSHTLLGCPHAHYYNEKNEWICGIDPKPKKINPELLYNLLYTRGSLRF